MKRTPACDAAREYLRALIERIGNQPQRTLPTYRELAARAGVSTVTMWKCLRELERSGLVRKRRRGWEATGSVPVVAAVESRSVHTRVWQRTAERLRDDVRKGVYAAGVSLPLTKQLCAVYGVSPATMRRAVGALVSGGLLDSIGRGYRFSLHAGVTHPGTIVLVAFGRGQVEMSTPRTRDNFRAVESLCARNGLRLRVIALSEQSAGHADGVRELPRRIRQWTNVVGAMVWEASLQETTVLAVSELLHAEGLRVALLVESGDPSRALLGLKGTQVFVSGNAQADGLAVGQFLVARGHRRVGYVSPYGDELYSVRRRNGLIDAFERAGIYGAVGVYEERRLVDSATLSRVARRQILDINRDYRALDYGAFREMVRRRLMVPQLHQLFVHALEDPSASAWVCNNDTVAIEAVRYLRQAGVDVPSRIAVVGFDDSLDAFVEGLSSYSFDPSGLAQAMLNALLMPARRTATCRAPVSIEGFVNQRLTT
jgi:DNA-binding LacI/PurR family transcriptional regulator/DNA-binding transcriptional regulator YhcF (GntR family)